MWNIRKAQWKHRYFISWFAGNCLASNTNILILWLLMQLSCVVLWTKKCNLQGPKIKDKQRMYRNMLIFHTSLQKISNNFQGIHHYIVNLWGLCVCLFSISLLPPREIWKGRQITISKLKNIAERCDSMFRHLVFYASFVQIMFTEMKENLVLNFK